MRFRAMAIGALCAALAACGSKNPVEPVVDSLAGTWAGTASSGVIVELGVTSSDAGTVAGCVRFGFDPQSRPDDRVIVAASGVVNGDSVVVAVPAGQAVSWSFQGVLVSPDTLSGSQAGGELSGHLQLVRSSSDPGC